MRIIAGEYRGRTLKNPTGQKTRPTSDRLRETLFNILNPLISPETRFLDLCAGTGAIGIEAISRGCEFSTFVDISRRSCALIEENLNLLRISEVKAEIICIDAEKFVSRQNLQPWDLIFFDPPYNIDYAKYFFAMGANADKLLLDNGNLIIEHHFKKILPDVAGALRRGRILKQGETQLSFYQKQELAENL